MGSVVGFEGELAVDDLQVDAWERAAHGAGAGGLAGRGAGELAGLGLAVAVADPEAGGLVPGVQDLGVERLAGGDQALGLREAR